MRPSNALVFVSLDARAMSWSVDARGCPSLSRVYL